MSSISETELHPEPHFLGLDASTQALKASLLSANLDVLHEAAVNFDADLPQLGTKGGVLRGPDGSGEVYAPVEVLGLAMDLLMERIKAKRWNMSAVRGVAAAGQQHASVYWSQQSAKILSSIEPSEALAPQLAGAYSRSTIPNWQDSSTTAECRTLDAAFGGSAGLARATGSKAHERFTGAQIMRFKSTNPAAYAQTDRISLVSSAITTLLCLDGEVKGIDESDACGMNLWTMDRKERGWNDKVLQVIAGGKQEDKEELARKLGKVETDGGRVVGMIGRWYVERYGFHPECCVFPGTGDNPATFLSLTLRPNEGLVSLGTSDVVLVSTSTYNPHPEYHAFFHPAQIAPPSTQDAGEKRENTSLRYFNMLVYKNGSLAREHVRDVYFDKSWDKFNAAVEERRPTSGDSVPGDTAFWWLLPDIIPDNASGVHKYTTSPHGVSDKVSDYPDRDTNAIAILSSQLLNYRARSSAILDSRPVTVRSGSGSVVGNGQIPPTPMSPFAPRSTSGTNGYFTDSSHSLPSLSRVYATGGASANKTITSLMADILDAPVSKNVEYDVESGKWVDAHWNACSVGVAYKARWGYERYLAAKAAGEAQSGSSDQASRPWIDFDTLVQECRDRRAALGKRLGRGNKMSDGTELQEEGIRNVAVPGPGKEAWEGRVGWWAQLEARALRGE